MRASRKQLALGCNKPVDIMFDMISTCCILSVCFCWLSFGINAMTVAWHSQHSIYKIKQLQFYVDSNCSSPVDG